MPICYFFSVKYDRHSSSVSRASQEARSLLLCNVTQPVHECSSPHFCPGICLVWEASVGPHAHARPMFTFVSQGILPP